MFSPIWDAQQYRLFAEARLAPALDLQALIPEFPYQRIIDLGCGTGEQTAMLARRFPQAEVLGIDSSPEMLGEAFKHRLPNLHFEQRDITALSSEWDLIYANASLQWLPDHPALLAQLWTSLSSGGVLAVQVPANHDHLSHRLLSEVAEEFRTELGGYTRFGPAHGASPVLSPAQYAEVLDRLGAVQITALSKVYPIVLAGAEGLLAWMKGTALRPYLSRLQPLQAQAFEGRYLECLRATYPTERLFYAFTRTLFVAQRTAQQG